MREQLNLWSEAHYGEFWSDSGENKTEAEHFGGHLRAQP